MATVNKDFIVKNGIVISGTTATVNGSQVVDTSATAQTKTGNFTSSGEISGSILKATQAAGDEGGEIQLALASTNTTLSTGVAIDIYQDKLRIFETGGTNRGAYITLSSAGTGVGSNLLAGGSASNSFSTIVVSGQGNVVATSPTDTLTFVAGTFISITTVTASDSITFSASHSHTIDDLSDVAITSATTDQVLVYSTTGSWVNAVAAPAGVTLRKTITSTGAVDMTGAPAIVYAVLVGGGGAGGSSNSTTTVGGGGGGGCVVAGWVPAETYAVIGAGGTPATSQGGSGGITYYSILFAAGGSGGGAASTTTGANSSNAGGAGGGSTSTGGTSSTFVYQTGGTGGNGQTASGTATGTAGSTGSGGGGGGGAHTSSATSGTSTAGAGGIGAAGGGGGGANASSSSNTGAGTGGNGGDGLGGTGGTGGSSTGTAAKRNSGGGGAGIVGSGSNGATSTGSAVGGAGGSGGGGGGGGAGSSGTGGSGGAGAILLYW